MDSNGNHEAFALIQRVRQGDEDSFAQLVEMYKPMISGVIKRFSLDEREVFSDACMALYKAALSFDVEQNEVTFGLYAGICVTNRMYDVIKISPKPLPLDSERDVESIAVDGDSFSRLVRKEESRALYSIAKELLSDFEYNVFSMWLKGYKTADIAARFGKSAKSVDNAKARLLKKLREGIMPDRE